MEPITLSGFRNEKLCEKSRNFNFMSVEAEQGVNYMRSIVVKDTLKQAMMNEEKNPEAIMDYLDSRYDECGFVNHQQRQMQLTWDHKRIMRYIESETRTPEFPEGNQVKMGQMEVKVIPDFVFVENDTSAEVVKLEIGKPNLTQRGKKNARTRDLTLYAMVLYLRQRGFTNITASIYYLRKLDDVMSENRMFFNPDFFTGGGNVIHLTDIYDGKENELDRQMADMVAELNAGLTEDQMKDEDCASCKHHEICKYTLPPVRMDKNAEVVRRLGAVSLTKSQQEAVNYREGIVRINAGAGAGKTMVTALRTLSLLREGVEPHEICMLTFTNAGAKEMRERIELCIEEYGGYDGDGMENMTITTFNGFGDTVIGDNFKLLGYTKKPKVIDDVERFSIIAKLISDEPIAEWTGDAFLNFTSTISYAKGALQIASDVFQAIKKMELEDVSEGRDKRIPSANDVMHVVPKDTGMSVVTKLIGLYGKYAEKLKKNNLIEYADQEIALFEVINLNPRYLPERHPYKHIVVDEFQDSSLGQINLIKVLTEIPTFKSLMVVGDDSQAIFGFRDTSPEYIINFADHIGKPVDDIYLLENHRSTPEIIEFANGINQLNENRVEKDLVATRSNGVSVHVQGFYSKAEEYEAIVNGILGHLNDGVSPEDIAVIAYTKYELQEIADALTRKNIPSMFGAPEIMIANSRIRAIIAFAKVIRNRESSKDALIAANALIGGGIMDLSEAKLKTYVDNILLRCDSIDAAASMKAKKELFIDFIDEIAMDDETVEYFRDGLENKDFDEILQYCKDFAVYGENMAYRRLSEYPGVVLTTAHSSKGLEWPIVYNTLSKYQKTVKTNEEVRRLLFVSATRARDELNISAQYVAFGKSAKTRQLNNYLQECYSVLDFEYAPAI